MGFSISTKLISVGSVLIYIFLFLFSFGIRKNIKNTVIHIVSFILIALFISLPWLIFSYLNTGNPIYPIFSGYSLSPVTHLFSPINFLKESWILFTRAGDPLSPIYIIILPVIIVLVKRLKKNEKLFALYSFLGLIVWYITPRTGGGRFILPYLPVASIFMVMLVSKFPSWLKKYSITLIILISLISIGYRAFANKRYLPVILGKQTKGDFLIKNLNFKFGDFYDIDGYFAKTIKPTDRVLIYGIHNLYYADFPFIHESYLKKGDRFNYILLGNAPELGGLPRKYSNWRLIYQNDKLGIKFYAD